MTHVTSKGGDASLEAEATVAYSLYAGLGQEGNLGLVGLLALRHDDDQPPGA
jgi:hypothetical protein